jgi:putative glutamine amidotransferase
MTRPPLIGINSDIRGVVQGREGVVTWLVYVRAVAQAGATPLIIPPIPDEDRLAALLDRLDGLVLIGGPDLSPDWYGQEPHSETVPAHPLRLEGDRLLGEMALSRPLPILAICMGCQLVNVLLGGDLIQDIPSLWDGEVIHSRPKAVKPAGGSSEKPPEELFHRARVEPGSRLAGILGKEELEVNSSHHQALGRLGRDLRAVAWAPDGIIEAAEGEGERFLLSVQWHPERIVDRPEQLALFQALVREAHRERE